MSSSTVLLSLGSNIGDSVALVRAAISAIQRTPNISEVDVSPLYRSEPWGKTDQQDFVNCCVTCTYTDTPLHLMETLQKIERNIGQKAERKWEAREIDIDIVLFGDTIVNAPDLNIPHPHFRERNFVLQPACDIAPNLIDPVSGNTIEYILRNSPDELKVLKLA